MIRLGIHRDTSTENRLAKHDSAIGFRWDGIFFVGSSPHAYLEEPLNQAIPSGRAPKVAKKHGKSGY
jgi:hypothetical protein